MFAAGLPAGGRAILDVALALVLLLAPLTCSHSPRLYRGSRPDRRLWTADSLMKSFLAVERAVARLTTRRRASYSG